jgi:hypothetical protein
MQSRRLIAVRASLPQAVVQLLSALLYNASVRSTSTLYNSVREGDTIRAGCTARLSCSRAISCPAWALSAAEAPYHTTPHQAHNDLSHGTGQHALGAADDGSGGPGVRRAGGAGRVRAAARPHVMLEPLSPPL